MREPPVPSDLWSASDAYQGSGDARAELAAVHRELVARLVTVLSRRLSSSTSAARRTATSYGSDPRWAPNTASRDVYAGRDSARFDISTAGPRLARWPEALLAAGLIALGIGLSAPAVKIALWAVGGVLLVHSAIRGLRGS